MAENDVPQNDITGTPQPVKPTASPVRSEYDHRAKKSVDPNSPNWRDIRMDKRVTYLPVSTIFKLILIALVVIVVAFVLYFFLR